MSSEKQVTANRENAKLSTGPKSPEGKAACSQNATRHALCSRGFIIRPGQELAFTNLESQYRLSLRPIGEVQETLFLRLLESAWTLHRCRIAEAELYLNSPDQNLDPILDEKNAAQYARIQKYARQAENSLHKATRELSKLQTEWHYRNQIHPLTEAELNDDEQFERTPQSKSEICNLQQAIAHANRDKRKIPTNSQNKANLNAFMREFIMPPSIDALPMPEIAPASPLVRAAGATAQAA